MLSIRLCLAVLVLPGIALFAGCHGDSMKPDQPGKSPYPMSTAVRAGPLQVVHEFSGPMPTGVTVSHDKRIFVNYPRWEDSIRFTVAEIKDGKEVPYPDEATNSGDTPDTLFSVQSVDALADEKRPDEQVAAILHQEKRDFASDGLESDAQGRVYLTDWEHNAIHVRTGEGQYQTLVTDPRMWWPDTLSLATDGKLYFTCNQLHRQAKFHNGQDLRKRPFYLFSVQTDGRPVVLTK